MKEWFKSAIAASIASFLVLVTVCVLCLPVVLVFGLLKYILG